MATKKSDDPIVPVKSPEAPPVAPISVKFAPPVLGRIERLAKIKGQTRHATILYLVEWALTEQEKRDATKK